MLPRYLRQILKTVAFRTPVAAYLAPRYLYNFRPSQLAFLINALDEISEVSGSILEVGCFGGATTVFLSEHLKDTSQSRQYIAIDTFAGFLYDDVQHELSERGKTSQRAILASAFASNRRDWVRRSLDLSGHSAVRLVEADAGSLDYEEFAPVAFALIDVDLYRPVIRALKAIVPCMSKGGIIVVDDCRPDQVYDGALAAYMEWCRDSQYRPEIVHTKLGVIRL